MKREKLDSFFILPFSALLTISIEWRTSPMLRKKLSLLLVASAFWLSPIAEAREVDVRVGDVHIKTSPGGSTYVNSGQTRLSVPSTNRSYIPYYRTFNRYTRYTPCCCSSIYQQQTSQTNGYSRTNVQRSVSSTKCSL